MAYHFHGSYFSAYFGAHDYAARAIDYLFSTTIVFIFLISVSSLPVYIYYLLICHLKLRLPITGADFQRYF